MINLKQFCANVVDEPQRSDISQPFSSGEFTYATNGHIAVRVARRDDAVEAIEVEASTIKRAATLCKIFDEAKDQPLKPFSLKLPEPLPLVECTECEGDGRPDHDCPTCECTCDACDGLGKIEQRRRFRFVGFDLQEKYLRQLAVLPGLNIGTPPNSAAPVLFSFDGGLALLMPMRQENLFVNELVVEVSELMPIEAAREAAAVS